MFLKTIDLLDSVSLTDLLSPIFIKLLLAYGFSVELCDRKFSTPRFLEDRLRVWKKWFDDASEEDLAQNLVTKMQELNEIKRDIQSVQTCLNQLRTEILAKIPQESQAVVIEPVQILIDAFRVSRGL